MEQNFSYGTSGGHTLLLELNFVGTTCVYCILRIKGGVCHTAPEGGTFVPCDTFYAPTHTCKLLMVWKVCLVLYCSRGPAPSAVLFSRPRPECCIVLEAPPRVLYCSRGPAPSAVLFSRPRPECCIVLEAPPQVLYCSRGPAPSAVLFLRPHPECCIVLEAPPRVLYCSRGPAPSVVLFSRPHPECYILHTVLPPTMYPFYIELST